MLAFMAAIELLIHIIYYSVNGHDTSINILLCVVCSVYNKSNLDASACFFLDLASHC